MYQAKCYDEVDLYALRLGQSALLHSKAMNVFYVVLRVHSNMSEATSLHFWPNHFAWLRYVAAFNWYACVHSCMHEYVTHTVHAYMCIHSCAHTHDACIHTYPHPCKTITKYECAVRSCFFKIFFKFQLACIWISFTRNLQKKVYCVLSEKERKRVLLENEHIYETNHVQFVAFATGQWKMLVDSRTKTSTVPVLVEWHKQNCPCHIKGNQFWNTPLIKIIKSANIS